MKNIRFSISIFLLAMFAGVVVLAQQADTSQVGNNTGQQVNEGGDNANTVQQNPADTTGASSMGTRQADTGNQNTNANSDDTASTDARVSNTPAVPQTSTSQSGSPAVLSGEDGSERDGTNNVQRASMNMVGSPVDNLNLDANESVDPDAEMKDRQDQTQE